MIVRDESHIVHEALASVASHIDCLVAVDTGSTDNTVEIIRAWMADNGVPGVVHERPWRDFGHNRSEALALAAGWADYIWVIDADDLLVGDPDLSRLRGDSYLLHHEDGVRYWRKQILRDGLPWRYEGVVHEYVTCDEPADEERLVGDYHVASRRLGARSTSPEKYARDAALLLEAVLSDPEDARATFYLAQSYFDSQDYGEARRWYARRAEMGGFGEEIFFSLMRVAACLTFEEQPWEQVLATYLAAYQARPTRAEPLFEIARHFRLTHDFELGYLFARQAAEIAEPDDLLFVDSGVYEWRARDEMAVCAYHTGRREECLQLSSALLALDGLPEGERPRIERNRDACLPDRRGPSRTGGLLAEQLDDLSLAELRIEVEPDWPCTEASIATTGDAFTALVRTSPEAGSSAAVYYLVDLGPDLGVRSVRPCRRTRAPKPSHGPSAVCGWPATSVDCTRAASSISDPARRTLSCSRSTASESSGSAA